MPGAGRIDRPLRVVSRHAACGLLVGRRRGWTRSPAARGAAILARIRTRARGGVRGLDTRRGVLETPVGSRGGSGEGSRWRTKSGRDGA